MTNRVQATRRVDPRCASRDLVWHGERRDDSGGRWRRRAVKSVVTAAANAAAITASDRISYRSSTSPSRSRAGIGLDSARLTGRLRPARTAGGWGRGRRSSRRFPFPRSVLGSPAPYRPRTHPEQGRGVPRRAGGQVRQPPRGARGRGTAAGPRGVGEAHVAGEVRVDVQRTDGQQPCGGLGGGSRCAVPHSPGGAAWHGGLVRDIGQQQAGVDQPSQVRLHWAGIYPALQPAGTPRRQVPAVCRFTVRAATSLAVSAVRTRMAALADVGRPWLWNRYRHRRGVGGVATIVGRRPSHRSEQRGPCAAEWGQITRTRQTDGWSCVTARPGRGNVSSRTSDEALHLAAGQS